MTERESKILEEFVAILEEDTEFQKEFVARQAIAYLYDKVGDVVYAHIARDLYRNWLNRLSVN